MGIRDHFIGGQPATQHRALQHNVPSTGALCGFLLVMENNLSTALMDILKFDGKYGSIRFADRIVGKIVFGSKVVLINKKLLIASKESGLHPAAP